MPRLRDLAVALAVLLLLLTACSGDKSKGAAPDAKAVPNMLKIGDKGLVEITGGKERLLVGTREGAYVNGVAVSPDNKRLAFVLQPPASTNDKGEIDFGADLWVSNRDGSDRKEVIPHASNGEFIFDPTWTPDSQRLVYVVRGRDEIGEPDFRLESFDMASGTRTRLLQNAVDAGLAPDGKTVAYVYYDAASSDPEVFLLGQLGSKDPPKVLVPGDSGIVLIQSPVFSPDGTRIAFAASSLFTMAPTPRPGGLFASVAYPMHPTLQDVWLINTDGTGLKRLSEIVESQPSVDWSDDGKYIYALGGGGFWKVDATTGETKQVGPGEPGGIIRILRHN